MMVTRMAWGLMITDLPASPVLMPRIEFSILGRNVIDEYRGRLHEHPIPRNWYFVVLPCK